MANFCFAQKCQSLGHLRETAAAIAYAGIHVQVANAFVRTTA